jgi:hypothetical protein
VPIHRTSGGKWQWGSHGTEYPNRAGAERQAAAAHANGYRGDDMFPKKPTLPAKPAKKDSSMPPSGAREDNYDAESATMDHIFGDGCYPQQPQYKGQ